MVKLTDNAFLFSCEGRINRVKYWYASFASIASGLVFLTILALAIAGIFGAGVKSVHIMVFDIFGDPPSLPFGATFGAAEPGSTATLVSLLFYLAGTPVFIFSMWFLAATTIKRLHDRDRSGWWMPIFFVVPALFGKLSDKLGGSSVAVFLAWIAVALSLWGIVELYFLKGTRGPNRFGPDPLAPVDTEPPLDTRPPWDQQSQIEFVPHKASSLASSHVMRGHD